MLTCEGYRMFKGQMRITPKDNSWPSHIVESTWLYKPEYKCWYGAGGSYSEDICEIVEDRTND